MSELALSDVKVLDLSRLLPGPYATLILADLGARVDKLEDPGGGDYIRHMPPLMGEESALFYATNPSEFALRVQGVAASSDTSWDGFQRDSK